MSHREGRWDIGDLVGRELALDVDNDPTQP
ncbi:MAG: hypothetical protein QOF31_3778 [Mycobacterium sp.]|jgi:hypothetical protein|nr:hypothetical protein [Mycobacterium sp.]